MDKWSTRILRILAVLAGLGVLLFLILVIPDEVLSVGDEYLYPIAFIMYLSAVPFFYALFQALILLNYLDANKGFSKESIKALKKIKYSAIAFSLMYLAIFPYMFILAQIDDAPGVGAFGLIFVSGSMMVGTFAAVLQRLIQNGVDLKSENDLTV